VAAIHTHRELMTLYYDYAQGSGNGRIPKAAKSPASPSIRHGTPAPCPRDKWGHAAGDAELGLIPA
jgi:glutathione S-transferase